MHDRTKPLSEQVALEEIKLLQAIIARHEDHAFKVRAVMYALITALAAAAFGDHSHVRGAVFGLIAGVITVISLAVELVHRAIVRMAINRSRNVEEVLRSGGTLPYDGPLIAESFAYHSLLPIIRGEAFEPFLWVHYVGLWLVITTIALVTKL